MGLYIVIFAVGVIFGGIVTLTVCGLKHIGTLRVDTSDPYEEPYLFLELRKNTSDIRRKKYVLLKVNINSYITHK